MAVRLLTWVFKQSLILCSIPLTNSQLYIYTITKKNKNLDVEAVTSIKRIATSHFSSVNFGSDLIFTGGKFEDDNTCS